MRVVISNRTGAPIYEQIKEQIKTEILSGALQEGEQLPSIRQLAHDLRISVITTTRAYSDLEQEGFIVTVQGKGTFVQAQDSELAREQLLREVEAGLSSAVKAARLANLSREEFDQILEMIFEADSNE